MKTTFIIVLLLNCLSLCDFIIAQQEDTTKTKPVQIRRGIPLQQGYRSYDDYYYSGKDMFEEKRSHFPLSGTGIWTELNPQVPRVDYRAVHFVNKDTGVTVGKNGAIIRTTNGGGKWLNVITPYNITFRGIEGQSEGRIIAVGDSGTIILSDDFGKTWKAIESGTNHDLYNLQMINDDLGWLVGDKSMLLKTTDGGFNWVQQFTQLTVYPFFDVSFLDSLFGYIAVDVGQILRTTDGGLNWDLSQVRDQYSFNVIKAVTRKTAVALGFAGKQAYTSDGGETWQFITYLGSTFRDIAFLDTLKGFAVGFSGSFDTTDGGFTWNLRLDIKNAGGITFPSPDIGYLVGDELILDKTTNSGQNWFRKIINDDFTDVFFTDENNGWFIGYAWYQNNLYQTTDGGVTLKQRTDFPGDRPSSVYFLDSLTGFVGANEKIFKTNDGGISWQEKNIFGIDSLLFAGEFIRLFFISDSIGWALNYGYVIKTTDGGENWNSQLNVSGLTGIHFSDSFNGWITPGVKPFKTTNGGKTWIEQTNFPENSMYDVFFNDSLNSFISKSNELYQTLDGGINWTLVSNVTNFSYGRFSNRKQNGIFLAGGPRTYRSEDAGANWEEVIELRDQFVEYVRLLDINNGCAVGRRGLILRLADSVVYVSGDNSPAPEEFQIYQNYPNPFNNSTFISFNLPEKAKIKITIYDSLGRLVKGLIDKEFESGFHTVNFIADDLASGIYLYKIEGGGFNEVKKMVLLK